MSGATSTKEPSTGSPSTSFQRAVDNFNKNLTVKQRQEFSVCNLEDVRQTVVTIQEKQGSQKKMRNLARIQAFLEAMEQYEEVMKAFLNCTPFLGYIWGPIKFILLVANTWVDSLNILLDAYKEIGERIPSFVQYQGLFEKNPEMRRALDLYYCDILEFHYHALQFLSRPGWRRLFSSSWKTFETQFRCIQDSLGRHKDLIESEKGTLAVFEAQRVRELAEAHFKEISELEKGKQLTVLIGKLNAPDYNLDHHVASEQRRRSRSGTWVLQNVHFRKWSEMETKSNPLLYVHGVPGAGKTILASLIIEQLQERKQGRVLFFYCKHKQPEKNTFSGILRGLLTQILSLDNTLSTYLYQICSSKDQAGLSTILEQLAEIAFDCQDTSFIVLDGLDECKPGEAEKALSWFKSRQRDAMQADLGHIRLLCVGQRTDALQHMLSSAVDISLENASHQGDIERFVKEKACNIREDFEISSQIEAEIVTRVTDAAKSMFLFAKLVMENLSNQTSQYDVIKELQPETFPVDLQEAYERVVSIVFTESPHGIAAKRITAWVACAKRPLRWREIQATFFIDPKMSTCNFPGRRLRKSCKKLCGSLIDLQRVDSEPETEAVLHLVHDTARDYLIHKGLINLSLQHAKMALFCTEYLLSDPFHFLMQLDQLKECIRHGYYAFQDYAVSCWLDHMISSIEISIEGPIGIRKDLVRQLKLFLEDYGHADKRDVYLRDGEFSNFAEIFSCIPKDVGAWSQWFNLEWRTLRIRSAIESLGEEVSSDDADRELMRNIYGAWRFKCSRLECNDFATGFGSRLLRDEHLNRHNRPFICVEKYCPFQALGFETKAQLDSHLIRNHNLDDATQFMFPQPQKKNDNIHKASARGDVVAVKYFLDSGANANIPSRPNGGETPLFLATRESHLRVCKTLLANGADANFKGPKGSNETTALHVAASCGDIEIVHCLLSTDNIDAEARDKYGWTPLSRAADKCHEGVVQLLLATDKFDINAQDDSGWTPLSRAADRGSEAVVRLLLAAGNINPDTKSNDGCTPLSRAANKGHEGVVQLLLATDKVDINMQDNSGWTPLSNAADRGSEAVVRLLLATGHVNPDMKSPDGRTPLSRAADKGYERVVQLLLATGKVDINTQDDIGWTPLSKAADRGSEAVVRLLLATGNINPNIKSKGGWTSLLRAADKGHKGVVQLLLATGKVDINMQDNSGWTPLSRAADKGHKGVVQLLLATDKVDANTQDKDGWTPLSRAADNGHEAVTRLLLATDKVNADTKHKNRQTPLSRAALRGYMAVVQLLLATGKVDADTNDEYGWTPLSRAVDGGHEAVVQLLLATGKVNADVKHKDGQTPLSRAAFRGYKAVTQLLLATGKVDVDTKDEYGWTPLSRAIDAKHEAVVELLLATGKVDVDARHRDGWTPLVKATDRRNEVIVRLLLATGKVNPDTKYEDGWTPLSRAADRGDEAIVQLLLATDKVDVNTQDEDGWTPLSRAADKGYKGVVQLLLAMDKVDVNMQDKNGWTPLSRAAHKGCKAVVQLLLATGKVDADVKDKDGQTPLSRATGGGHKAVVQLIHQARDSQQSSDPTCDQHAQLVYLAR